MFPNERRALARARTLSARGRPDEAVEALTRACAGRPSVAVLCERAQLHFHQRHYDAALADLGRAIALAPRDGALRLQRSGVLAQIDRVPEAVADAERALRLCPDDEALTFSLVRLLLRGGRLERAHSLLADALRRPGQELEARLYRALVCLREKRPARAVADLDFILKAVPRGSNLALRARFYRVAAKALEGGRRAGGARNGPRLLLCGLGLYPPYTATLEALDALSRCEVVVNNVSGHETREFLAVLAPKIVPGMFDAQGDAVLWSARILGLLRRGAVVGFATRGHPLVMGGLGVELVRRCRQAGIPVETNGAFTSIDALVSRLGPACGARLDGLRACDAWTACEAPLDAAAALIIYFDHDAGRPFGPDGLERLRARLAPLYGARHPCWVFGPHYEADPALTAVGALGRGGRGLEPSQMLFVPPRLSVAGA